VPIVENVFDRQDDDDDDGDEDEPISIRFDSYVAMKAS
jgi:hypothetical protein